MTVLASCAPRGGVRVPAYRVEVLHGGAAVVDGEGPKVNGPSVIAVPDWVPPERRPRRTEGGREVVARYYLYYADHDGLAVKMRWSDDIESPVWYPYDNASAGGLGRGVLDLSLHLAHRTPSPTCGTPGLLLLSGTNLGEGTVSSGRDRLLIASICRGEAPKAAHVASPDVHVDDVARRFVMYFHSTAQIRRKVWDASRPGQTQAQLTGRQATFVATSADGLNFNEAGVNADGRPTGGQVSDVTGRQARYGIERVVLGPSYMRVFSLDSGLCAIARNGVVLAAPVDDGQQANGFEPWLPPEGAAALTSWVAASDKGASPLDVWMRSRFGGQLEPAHVAVDLVEVWVAGRPRRALEVFFWVRGGDGALWRVFYDVDSRDPARDEWHEWGLLRDDDGEVVADKVLRRCDVDPPGPIGDPAVFADPSSGHRYLFFAFGREGRIGVARLEALGLRRPGQAPNS